MSPARPNPIKDLVVIAAMNVAASIGKMLVLGVAVGVAWLLDSWVPLLIGLVVLGVGYGVLRIVANQFGALPIDQEYEPALARLVDEAVAQQQFPHRLVLRVVPEPDCSIRHQRVGLRHSFVLDIGWPMLDLMSSDEVRAVVTHELAHVGDLGSWRARARVAARNRLLESTITLPVITEALLRASSDNCVTSEFAADAVAADSVGAEIAASALLRTAVIDEIFSTLVEHWCEVMAGVDEYPVDLFESVRAAIDDPEVAAWLSRNASKEPEIDARDSHPTVRDRVSRLGVSPTMTRISGSSVSFRHADEIATWCLQTAFDPEDNDLRPASVLNSPLGRFDFVPDEALAELKAATESPDARAALEAAADHIEAGTWREFTHRLDESLDEAPAAVMSDAELATMVNCVGTGLIVPLVNAGWRRAHRWLNQILEAPDGQLANVFEVVEDAVVSGSTGRLRSVIGSAELGGVPAVPTAR